MHVSRDVIKMVEVLFAGQVNGGSRNLENKFFASISHCSICFVENAFSVLVKRQSNHVTGPVWSRGWVEV